MDLITIIDDREFAGLIKNSTGKLRNLGPVMNLAGARICEFIDDRFEREGRDADGLGWLHGWQPLADSTRQRKKAGAKILEGESLRLREGIHVESTTGNSVTVAPDDLPYARIQHLGGKAGRGLAAEIPARPYMILTGGELDEIGGMVADYVLGGV